MNNFFKIFCNNSGHGYGISFIALLLILLLIITYPIWGPINFICKKLFKKDLLDYAIKLTVWFENKQ